MKILYIGQYKASEYNGWNIATTAFIKALKTTDCKLTIRNINMDHSRSRGDPDILHLEDVKYQSYDIVIQHVLPNLLYYDGRFKQNISIHFFESDLNLNYWLYRMLLMDKIIVPSSYEQCCLSTKIKKPVYNIPIPTNIDKFKKDYVNQRAIFNPNIFYFLCIAEDNHRKNIDSLIIAYLHAFSINDSVCLIIKTNKNIGERINYIQTNSRRFFSKTKYAPILLLPYNISYQDILSLHQHSHCLVVPSKGESWCLPALDAVGFNKPVIYTKGLSIEEYCPPDCGWQIPSNIDICFTDNPPITSLYTLNETWFEPSIIELSQILREAYDNQTLYKAKCDKIKKLNLVANYSYEKIGQKFIEVFSV